MTTAVYAGSFDPVTLGHIDILKRSAKIFEKVIIGVTYNYEKKSFLDVKDRVFLIEECIKDISNAEVYTYEGLTVEFAQKHNASVLIRGIRNTADYEYEKQLAQINLKLNENIHTLLLNSNNEYDFISSTVVRELILHKQNLSGFVPEFAAEFLYKKFNYKQ